MLRATIMLSACANWSSSTINPISRDADEAAVVLGRSVGAIQPAPRPHRAPVLRARCGFPTPVSCLGTDHDYPLVERAFACMNGRVFRRAPCLASGHAPVRAHVRLVEAGVPEIWTQALGQRARHHRDDSSGSGPTTGASPQMRPSRARSSAVSSISRSQRLRSVAYDTGRCTTSPLKLAVAPLTNSAIVCATPAKGSSPTGRPPNTARTRPSCTTMLNGTCSCKP